MTLEFVALVGILLVIVGILLIMFSSIAEFFKRKEAEEREKVSIQGGALIMIGPIPIVISTDPRSAKLLMLLAIVLIIVMFLFIFSLRYWW